MSTTTQDLPGRAYPDAEEVFVYMGKDFRVSRNIRAHWFFDHIDKDIEIEDFDSVHEENKEMSVVGIVPKGGSPQEILIGEKFRITAETKVIYISRYYRQVYVLELSPSIIVADDEIGCCLYNTLLDSLKTSLESVTKSFTIPGTRTTFTPQIYVSVIVFVPFLAFEEDLTLVNCVLLTHDNVDRVLKDVEQKWAYLTTKLYHFSQPVMRKWAQIRRRHKSRLDSTCMADSVDSEDTEAETLSPHMARYYGSGPVQPLLTQIIPITESPFGIPKQIFECPNKERQVHLVEAKEEGYIIPELALLFMLRLGLTVVQTMPENTQSNVVIVTDGVAGMPAPESLQNILRELRSFTVSCSFIEVRGKSVSAPCFGHITSGDLFHFLATATFGGYLPNCKCVNPADDDVFINEGYKPVNAFHRALLCWSFQNALKENQHIAESIRAINPVFAELDKPNIDYDVHINTTYNTTLNEVLYVRLREGFTVKSVQLEKDRIQINLSLPFRPKTSLQYGINAPWPSSDVKSPVYVDLVVAGPEDEIRDLKNSKSTEGVYRANAMRVSLVNSLEDAARRIAQADAILLHIHSFNQHTRYYSIPAGVDKLPLFHYHWINRAPGKIDKLLMPKFTPRGKDPFSRFLRFWKPVCNMRQDEWQKWVHVHIERAILHCRLVSNICSSTDNKESRLSCEEAKAKLHSFLLKMASFALIQEELYVVHVTTREDRVPTYFYMIRVEQVLPFIVMKLAFLGGISSTERRKVVQNHRNLLAQLEYLPKGEKLPQKVLTTIKRPLERILIQYDRVPENIYMARWTREPRSGTEKPLRVENERHNAITKYLEGRRHVWRFPLSLSDDSNSFDYKKTRKIAEMVANAMLRRRLEEGFQIAWTQHMIIGLCRQFELDGRTMIEQYVLFQPATGIDIEGETTQPGFSLMAEYWREPCPAGNAAQIARERLDDELVICQFTTTHILSIVIDNRCNPINIVRPVAQEKNERFNEHTARVSFVDNPFNIHTLLKHSRRMLLHLPTFQMDGASRELRNATFADAFNAEFARYSNSYFDVQDSKVFALIFTQMLVDKGCRNQVDMEKFHSDGYDPRYRTRCRIFIKALDNCNCILIAFPAEDVYYHEEGRSWPAVVGIVDERLTNYSIRKNEPHNRVMEYSLKRVTGHRLEDNSSSLEADINGMYDIGDLLADANIMRGNYRPRALRTIIGEMQDAIMERATVSAFFKSLKLGIGDCLNKEEVSWILNELCDYTNFELHGISDSLECFCEHLNKPHRQDSTCCDSSNLQAVFDDILSHKNFCPVPKDPRYYFYNGSTPVQKELARRNSSLATAAETRILYPGGQSAYIDNMKYKIMRRGKKAQRYKTPTDCPLFVFFHCVLQLPNGEEEYVTVTYLPSCVNQVLRSADKTVDPKDLHKVRIKLLIYILTWPREPLVDDEGIDASSSTAKKFISKLPSQEKETIKETLGFMNRILELEKILLSREYCDLAWIQTVSKIITKSLGKSHSDISKERDDNFLGTQVTQRFRKVDFVLQQPDTLEKLLNRLDGKTIDYCTLRRAEGSNIFYICQADPPRNLSRTGSEFSLFSGSPRVVQIPSEIEKAQEQLRQEVGNFWVILSIAKTDDEDLVMRLQFCERYASEPSQQQIYNETWAVASAEIRKINQELLLEDMFHRRLCSPLLLIREEQPLEKGMESDESDEDDDERSLDLTISGTAYYDFAPGQFACPLVWEHWIEINPRLRRPKDPRGPLHEVAAVLRRSLEQYMVSNMPNLFVFRFDEDDCILYGQIYSSFDQFKRSGKKYNLENENMTEAVRERFKAGGDVTAADPKPDAITQEPETEPKEKAKEYKPSLLFAAFGVVKPSPYFKRWIAEGQLEKRVAGLVLEKLVELFRRNRSGPPLEPHDVDFIQADERRPAVIMYFSIPEALRRFTAAVRLYYLQHMSFNHIEEARLSHLRPSESLLSGSQTRLHPFKSYPVIVLPGQPSNPKYTPLFLMYNRFKEKGSTDFGMAVIELRIVSEKGVIMKPCDGLIRQESHQILVPDLEEPNAVYDWFKRASTANCELRDGKLKPNQQPSLPTVVPGSCGYVQAIVWQVGDVGLTQLEQTLTSVVEGSFLDIITEYGILNTEIVEAAQLQPPPSPSAITPTKIKTPLSAQKLTSSARKRDSTETLHLSGGQQPPSTPLTADGSKRNSAVFTYEPQTRRGSNHDIAGSRDDFVLPVVPRIPEHLNYQFKFYLEQWFEHISVKRDDIVHLAPDTYQKNEFVLRHSVLVQQALNQIEFELKVLLKHKIEALSDKVQLFQNAFKGTKEQPRYDLVTGSFFPLKDENASDVAPSERHPRYILIAYCEEVHRDSRRYGYEISKSQQAPTSLTRLAYQNNECKWLYLPNIEEAFVPRQTFLYLKEHNNTITLYTYNFLPQYHDDVANMVLRIVMWQNAKYRLYEHIVDHPLDPVLPPVPEDERIAGNSYIPLIAIDPDTLVSAPTPPNSIEGMGIAISSEVAQRLFRVRRSYTAQVAQSCKVQRAFQQFIEMRKEVKQQVYAYQSNKLMYDELCNGTTAVSEAALTTMWGHCRRVHYVQTPVLLSPAWRRKIAQVRRGVFDHPAAKSRPVTTAASSLSSIARSRAGTAASGAAVARQASLPTKTKEEEELYDPCHVKMLHDLTEEYVTYLSSLGLSLLNVGNLTEESASEHRYKMEYPQGGRKTPDICLYKQLMHGVLLVRLHFVPPYFIMYVGMWTAPELLLRDQSLTELDSKKYLTDLELAKDLVVSRSHIHSFTYDFHLRMISRYLIHKEVLFPNGYNTSTFLIDFLKYYACRPPSARNCVYEERTPFQLHKNVNSAKVWECFLDKHYEEKYRWKVLRIRITDEETDPTNDRTNEYMLASCVESPRPDGYAKICVLLRDRRKRESDGCITLAQYMILVDQNRNRPLEESRQREDSSKSNVGEFQTVKMPPTEEQMRKEVDELMAGLQEGVMPTVEGMTRRRRYSSGSSPPIQMKSSAELESVLHSPVGLHGSESDSNVPVQGDPTLRHRKKVESGDEGEIPREKANYMQYISIGQRKLQQLLEETTKEYSEIIETAVSHANKECLREFLWCSVQTMFNPVPQLPKLGPSVRLGSSSEIWNSLRCIQLDVGQHIIELCELVEKESMKDRELRLRLILNNANCARLCRFLAYYFGPGRCRFFESCINPQPHPPSRHKLDVSPDQALLPAAPKYIRHLLITNPDNPVVFLLRCEKEITPDCLILFRKDVTQLKEHFVSLLDKAFDEIVQSCTAFLWSDLIYRPPGKAT